MDIREKMTASLYRREPTQNDIGSSINTARNAGTHGADYSRAE